MFFCERTETYVSPSVDVFDAHLKSLLCDNSLPDFIDGSSDGQGWGSEPED